MSDEHCETHALFRMNKALLIVECKEIKITPVINAKATELRQERKKSKIAQKKVVKHKFTRDTPLPDPRKANIST